MAIGGAHAAAFVAVLWAARWSTPEQDVAVASQAPWLPLLIAQVACAASLLGLGPAKLWKRVVWFIAAMSIVLACFFTATSMTETGATRLFDVETLEANAAQWKAVLILIAIPALCLGGLLQLLRLATGPVTPDAQQPRATPRRRAAETVVLGALIFAALMWGKATIDEQEMSDFTPSALTANLTYLATQLLGAAAFAFAAGGFWRIVGFTYVVCVAMQGFVNQPSRDLAAFWSAAGPWIVVLSSFLALRWAGYLFLASHSDGQSDLPATPGDQ